MIAANSPTNGAGGAPGNSALGREGAVAVDQATRVNGANGAAPAVEPTFLITATFFDNVYDQDGKPAECTFDELALGLRDHLLKKTCTPAEFAAWKKSKETLPNFTVCTFDGPSCRRHTQTANMCALDLDKITQEETDATITKLQGVRSFVYGSPSDGRKPNRCIRIVTLLDREVNDAEYDIVVKTYAHLLGVKNDYLTERIECRFYVGKAAGDPDRQFIDIPGAPLPVDALLAQGEQLLTEGKISRRGADVDVPDEEIDARPPASNKRVKEFVKQAKDLPAKTTDGLPKNARFWCAVEGARLGLNAEQIIAVMKEHYLPRHTNCETTDNWLKKNVRNAIRWTLKKANLQLCPDGKPWIVQKENFFWHRQGEEGTYTDAFSKSELGVRLERDLAAFIQIHTIEGKRYQDATIEKLYVMPAHETRASYMSRENTFIATTRVLTVATLKWRPLSPTKHTDVDRWLRILGGEDYPRLEQWIASVVGLDRPAPILYLHGDKNIGKGLLAYGLGQIWGHSPGDFGEAISSFNGEQERTPLLFADEGFPPDLDFQRLRSMVTEHSRRINEKYRPKYTLYGCSRIFVAANNGDALRYQRTGTLTEADVDAIADRLLVIACPKKRSDEAREFLTTINTNEWANRSIAEHTLWLHENVELEPSGQRMAAQPAGGRRLVMLMAGARFALLVDHLVDCIENATEAPKPPPLAGPAVGEKLPTEEDELESTSDVLIKKGRVLVEPSAVALRLHLDARTVREAMGLLALHDAEGKPVRVQVRQKGTQRRPWFKELDPRKICEVSAEPPDLANLWGTK
jgi:hypothetical protein